MTNTGAAAVNPNIDRHLTKEEIQAAALRLHCEPAMIGAVAEVESTVRGAFDNEGYPTLLFERHCFSAYTHGRYDASHPDLSNPIAGGWGKYNDQLPRMRRAALLDADAAHRAASWGYFQILGANWKQAGCVSLDHFVEMMCRDIRAQLELFCNFNTNDLRLLRALREKDFAGYARIYNGPRYIKYHYDTKLRLGYEKCVGLGYNLAC